MQTHLQPVPKREIGEETFCRIINTRLGEHPQTRSVRLSSYTDGAAYLEGSRAYAYIEVVAKMILELLDECNVLSRSARLARGADT